MSDNIGREFWTFLGQFIDQHALIIDRPKGSHHPKYFDLIYPLDYGYLKGSISHDGGGIDVWIGEEGSRKPSAIVCTVDLRSNDLEIKLLLGCSEEEIATIIDFHNSGSMRCVLIKNCNHEDNDEFGSNT